MIRLLFVSRTCLVAGWSQPSRSTTRACFGGTTGRFFPDSLRSDTRAKAGHASHYLVTFVGRELTDSGCTRTRGSLRCAVTTTPARAPLQRLGRFLDGFSACFSRRPQREAASRYLGSLLNDSERKTMLAMHGRLSDPGQYQALQHFMTDSPWDAERVWTQLRAAVPVRAGISPSTTPASPRRGRTRWACRASTVGHSARSAFAR